MHVGRPGVSTSARPSSSARCCSRISACRRLGGGARPRRPPPLPTCWRAWQSAIRSQARCLTGARTRSSRTPSRHPAQPCGRRQPAAHDLQPDRIGHGKALLPFIQPPEHSVQNELGRETEGVCRRAGLAPDCRRLLADRTPRACAHVGDPKLLDAFRSGADIHTRTASEGPRHRSGARRPGRATPGEGRQLRDHLWTQSVRAGQAAEHHSEERSGLHRPLL